MESMKKRLFQKKSEKRHTMLSSTKFKRLTDENQTLDGWV
jgi:hypothetical protein